ncbi:TetR/AcrR family transcriptional regulator [Kineococcus gynurae]|uniref:TetR/AcrR family transcriptional regulator n=1 Tax=Kineococcus gynurae TaxID=452979 RepID=A0ABV5LUC6_9ACTN
MTTALTPRRAATRERLLVAALDVLAEVGPARTSVEAVCERAGFTRGAFYSNFADLDDLVAGVYRRQSDLVLQQLEEGLQRVLGSGRTDVGEVVAEVLALLPDDRRWHVVRADLTAQALRRPEAATLLTTQRAVLRDRLGPVLRDALLRAGRRPLVAPEDLAGLLLAAHEHVAVDRVAGAPDRDHRVLVALVLGLTEPAADRPEETRS